MIGAASVLKEGTAIKVPVDATDATLRCDDADSGLGTKTVLAEADTSINDCKYAIVSAFFDTFAASKGVRPNYKHKTTHNQQQPVKAQMLQAKGGYSTIFQCKVCTRCSHRNPKLIE